MNSPVTTWLLQGLVSGLCQAQWDLLVKHLLFGKCNFCRSVSNENTYLKLAIITVSGQKSYKWTVSVQTKNSGDRQHILASLVGLLDAASLKLAWNFSQHLPLSFNWLWIIFPALEIKRIMQYTYTKVSRRFSVIIFPFVLWIVLKARPYGRCQNWIRYTCLSATLPRRPPSRPFLGHSLLLLPILDSQSLLHLSTLMTVILHVFVEYFLLLYTSSTK